MPSEEVKMMELAKDILRKGGTLLEETCPKCGGLQVKYHGRNICLRCGGGEKQSAEYQPADVFANLRNLVLNKMEEIRVRLAAEQDPAKQDLMASLLIKYVELVNKLGKQ